MTEQLVELIHLLNTTLSRVQRHLLPQKLGMGKKMLFLTSHNFMRLLLYLQFYLTPMFASVIHSWDMHTIAASYLWYFGITVVSYTIYFPLKATTKNRKKKVFYKNKTKIQPSAVPARFELLLVGRRKQTCVYFFLHFNGEVCGTSNEKSLPPDSGCPKLVSSNDTMVGMRSLSFVGSFASRNVKRWRRRIESIVHSRLCSVSHRRSLKSCFASVIPHLPLIMIFSKIFYTQIKIVEIIKSN